MNLESILTIVWNALNTPAGITVMAGVFLWLLNRIYDNKPAWLSYEGAIISAIKFAEKEIPDGSPNKGLARLDSALKYAVKVYEESSRKRASEKIKSSLREGIQITHDKLEAKGTLKK